MRRRAKKGTTAWWKGKFWEVFAQYIKKRDKYRCFTCPRWGEGRGMHAGHLYPRRAGGMNLYFNEYAVHAQCYHCNINLGGNGAVYERKIREVYGTRMANHLYKLSNQVATFIWGAKEYEYLIQVYKEKTKQLG